MSAQRRRLHRVVHTGERKAFARRRAQIWLQADLGPAGPALPDRAIATPLGVAVRTVERARQAWTDQGLTAGLQTAPLDHPRRTPRLDGRGEARRVALACGAPPPGFARWTGQLLADALIREGVVDTIAAGTVNRVLKKTRGSLGNSRRGARRSRCTPCS